MDEAQLELFLNKVVKAAVAEGITDTLLKLGIDAANPLEMQKDFQALRKMRTQPAEEIIDDRKMRTVFVKAMTALGVSGGLAALIWQLLALFF